MQNSIIQRKGSLKSSCSLTWSVFFPRIDDSHCDRIHSSLTAVCCFDNGYVGQQPVAWKEYYVEYWLKEHQESMDRYNGCRDINEILLKTALNTIQSINIFKILTCHCTNAKFNNTKEGIFKIIMRQEVGANQHLLLFL